MASLGESKRAAMCGECAAHRKYCAPCSAQRRLYTSDVTRPNASVVLVRVKSWHVRSIGNQAAPNWSHGTQDNGSSFYNHISRKAKKTQKLLVGSTFVDSSKKDHPVSRG